MSQKQLHKHALPITILSVGALIVTIIAATSLSVSHTAQNSGFSDLLTSKILSISPTSNGVLHASTYQADSVADSKAQAVTPDTGVNISTPGSAAQVYIKINDLSQQTVN